MTGSGGVGESGFGARGLGFGTRGLGLGCRVSGWAGNDPRSDIDLVVIVPESEQPADPHLVDKLWELRASTDARIEPIPCGEREWDTDDTRPILEIARREGVTIAA